MVTIIVLSAVGILAVMAELVLPGGILGIVGMLCLFGAVGMTFAEYGMTAGTIGVAALFVFGLVTLNIWMKYFHKLPLTRSLILNDKTGRDENRDSLQQMMGQTGTTVTDITPSGHALFDGEKIDVMTEGPSIPKGSQVEVTATRGPSIIVRKLDA
jgi:membrane-bound serine protease (ClpP class)